LPLDLARQASTLRHVSSCFIPKKGPVVVKDPTAQKKAELPEVNWQVFTDGASSPDGRGGWAYVVVKDDLKIRRVQGSALGVTHQLMEVRAVVEGLRAFPRDVPVEVIGDSAYAIDCFMEEWYVRWEQNGWRNAAGKPVANRDEWERALAALRARPVGTTNWRRVPGHGHTAYIRGEHPWNELADELAVEAKGYC